MNTYMKQLIYIGIVGIAYMVGEASFAIGMGVFILATECIVH